MILHILLTGIFPFNDSTTKKITEKNRSCTLDFKDKVWFKVSEEGKDLCRQMIIKTPESRISASIALKHPWFSMKLPNKNQLNEVRKSLMKFHKDPNYELCELKEEKGENGDNVRLNLFLIARHQELEEMLNFTPRKARFNTISKNKRQKPEEKKNLKLNDFEDFTQLEKQITKTFDIKIEPQKTFEKKIFRDINEEIDSKEIPEEITSNDKANVGCFNIVKELSYLKINPNTKKLKEFRNHPSFVHYRTIQKKQKQLGFSSECKFEDDSSLNDNNDNSLQKFMDNLSDHKYHH